jgi:hypothetical protein
MRLVRFLIWVGTAFFVIMMFYPLVVRMFSLLVAPATPDLPY